MTDTMTTSTSESRGGSLAARRAAIAESGWGETFRVVQPRNLTFWVMVLLFVIGATMTLRGFSNSAQAYTQAFAQGTAWFAVFALLYMLLFTRLDRYSSIPGKAKLLVFLFGGLVTTFGIAAINNNAFRAILLKLGGSDFAQDWSAGLTAPWSEEIAKLMPVILMIGLAPRVMRCAFDGLIVGAISGLAFQVFENVAYVYESAASNFGQASYGTQTMLTRTFLGAIGHWTWSAVCGAGLIYLIGRPAERPRRLLGAGLILSSMLFHFVWDAVGALTGGAKWSVGLYVPLTFAILAVFIWTYRHTVPKERAWARAVLVPEVELGVISAAEMDAAIGRRKDRKRYIKSQGDAHRATKHVLEGAMDLADAVAASRGEETPDVERARSEIARLRGGTLVTA
jgi:RsiW-degrading membrane proteinase PrsW (M82 family)